MDAFLHGMVVLRGINFDSRPPLTSIPSERGVTSSKMKSRVKSEEEEEEERAEEELPEFFCSDRIAA